VLLLLAHTRASIVIAAFATRLVLVSSAWCADICSARCWNR
jgi:hypothetical protein